MRRLTTFAAGVLLLAAARLPLAAQTFPTNDPVLQRIWDIGMNNSQTERLAQALFDSIGPRLTGSPGQKAGNDWLVKMYDSWGIDAKNEKYGTWRGWRRGMSHIDLMTPRVRSLEGMMLAYSPGTGGKPVTGGVVMLPLFKDSAEFVKWLPEAKGKYVLLDGGALPSCRPALDWTTFGTPSSKARQDTLEGKVYMDRVARIAGTQYSFGLSGGALSKRLGAAGVAGVLTSRMSDQSNPTAQRPIGAAGIGMAGTWPIFETYLESGVGVALSCEDYGLVARLTANNQHPTLRVTADAELLGEVPVYNTIATVKGGEKADEVVMFSAHFDSWDAGSGATDNGTGTLVMLEAMRILKQAYPNPKRTLMAGHWSSEEQGLNGSTAWSEDHPEVVTKLQALFNQDNGTGRVRSVGGSGLPAMLPALEGWKAKLPTEWTDTAAVRFNFNPGIPRPGGTDGTVFGCRGAPHFGLGALGWNYGSETWHTNRDTYDKVVFDDLKFNATLTAMLAYLASEDPTFIDRAKVTGEWPASCGNPPRSTRAR
ncbi:MAG: M28 family peptidase [Longimicrobiales bacterium]